MIRFAETKRQVLKASTNTAAANIGARTFRMIRNTHPITPPIGGSLRKTTTMKFTLQKTNRGRRRSPLERFHTFFRRFPFISLIGAKTYSWQLQKTRRPWFVWRGNSPQGVEALHELKMNIFDRSPLLASLIVPEINMWKEGQL